MRLTPVLNIPPRFHFWKDFGAGKKRRQPYTRYWRNQWRLNVGRTPVVDHTLPPNRLPPGSRLMNAEDFMHGPIDFMPDDIIKMNNDNTVLSHPWPYNVELDPIASQPPMYNYTIDTRFFVPKDDCLVLTNTLLETEEMQAKPLFEPTSMDIENISRQYEWATSKDSVLVRLPKRRQYPRIDQKPTASFGLTKERKETTVLNYLNDYSQSVLAQHYHKNQQAEKLSELLDRKMIAFPRCLVPLERDSKRLNLNLCIDLMSISSSKPLPQINQTPEETCHRDCVDISPRSWRSLLEKKRDYSPNWSFTLPRNSYLNTIHLASRIKRDHRNAHEMMARSIIHSFGLTTQYARLRCYERQILATRSDEVSKLATVVLQDPLSIKRTGQHDDEDLLEEPVVLQTIAFDEQTRSFFFTRYQLNTSKLDGQIKNQAWHSGPISDLAEAFRYYLDFQSFDQSAAQATDWRQQKQEQEQQ